MIETTAATAATARASLPKATARETVGLLANVVLPTVAQGPIIRRPKMIALADRLDLDRRAVRHMQRLRDAYGDGPLLLPNPFRPQALILSPDHVHRVLAESPEPFASASTEKRASLSHFQPKGSLISHGAERADRRRFNEAVLETERSAHRLGERFAHVVAEEAGPMLAEARRRGVLDWDGFAAAWFRIVRRVVLGDAARDDHELTGMINGLRADANWAFLRPQRTALRERFEERLGGHLARAEPGSLAAVMAETPVTEVTAPSQQVPQWLFAFDPAGMATFRALALLAAHPEHAERARAEARAGEGGAVPDRPFLRASVLESLRLWPTAPMVLRQSTEATAWETGVMPAKTGILIFAPFFHRDGERLPEADRFAPELWMGNRRPEEWAFIPFSDGPVRCPGRNVVLLVTSAMLAEMLAASAPRLVPPGRLDARRPLQGTLNPYSLRFALGS